MASTLKKEVLQKYKNNTFVETGTLMGDGVQLALECGFKKIYSIDIDPQVVNFNKNKFKKEINNGWVEIIEGDTFKMFNTVVAKLSTPTTFWLDAHWDGGVLGEHKCPLPFELECLVHHSIKNHTILIDDRRLFGQLGSNWGEGINEVALIELIKKINPNYEILYEDGFVPNDILTAVIKQ